MSAPAPLGFKTAAARGPAARLIGFALALAGCAPTRPPPPAVAAAGPPPATRTARFRHPGILTNQAQLDLLRDRIKAGQQPWKAAYDTAMAKYGALTWTAKPRAVVDCGPYSRPNNGCSDERDDAVAAYTHALAWSITGARAHAEKAIAIMAAWAQVIEGHSNHNAPLQTGWAGSIWPLAGEILGHGREHEYDGWARADRDAFARMLAQVYLRPVQIGSPGTNGNWELVMIEAAAAIAVFLDDGPAFDRALQMWRRRVPAYFYLSGDGRLPVPPPGGRKSRPDQLIEYWYGQRQFVDGLAQETCRDFGHTEYGIASALAVAEIAYQQGIDLYREQGERLRAAMEFHASYLLGKPVPGWLCNGTIDARTLPTWEIGYNHFHDRMGRELPWSRQLLESQIRAGRGVDHHIVWETLTHAAAGGTGLP